MRKGRRPAGSGTCDRVRCASGGSRWPKPPNAPTPPATAWSKKAALTGNTAASTARRKVRRIELRCDCMHPGMPMNPGEAVATMDAPERYEQLIAFLDSNLPPPVDRQKVADGAVQFTGGEPAEVVVVAHRHQRARLGVRGGLGVAVHLRGAAAAGGRAQVAAAAGNRAVQRPERADQRRARSAAVTVSDVPATARGSTAPEWMHDDGVCQACADQHSGVDSLSSLVGARVSLSSS